MSNLQDITRSIPLAKELAKTSVLLLGPRRTGKSWIIRHQIKADQTFNLLRSDTFQQLTARPSLIREGIQPQTKLIVIDEIQKFPQLMDEVHLMIEETGVKFLLTGSSARKLKRNHTSLMAGRAKTRHLLPFTSSELGSKFNLLKILSFGALPPVVLSDEPEEIISSYVGDYLREEIQAEAMARKVENFSRFLFQSAVCNTEQLNYESVARDAQVPARTIREYYKILEDTLLGTTLEPLKTAGRRKPVSHGKFYFFDIGVVNTLLGTFDITERHPLFGKNFEHFILNEVRAFISYFKPKTKLNFWRTESGDEVDLVIDEEVGIEIKGTKLALEDHLKGIKALSEELTLKRKIIVSRDPRRRTLKSIEIIPYELFLEELWAGKIF